MVVEKIGGDCEGWGDHGCDYVAGVGGGSCRSDNNELNSHLSPKKQQS